MIIIWCPSTPGDLDFARQRKESTLISKRCFNYLGVAFGREPPRVGISRGLREDLVHPKHSRAHRDALVTAVQVKILRSAVSPRGS